MQTPRPSRHVLLTAGTLAAAATAAHAQSCIWTGLTAPPTDGSGRMVYHAGLARVLFVHTSYSAPARTWAWTGNQWVLLDSNGPSAREGAALAYDSSHDRLVLFGGVRPAGSGFTYLSDTWVWDQTSWTQTAAAGPAARAWASMTHDQARQRFVLFGGYAGPSTYFADTWEGDGLEWTLAATAGPSPRITSCFAYDSTRARTVLFGGGQFGQTLPPELWEWDGATWRLRSSTGPHPGASWMVFDPARARMIVGQFPVVGVPLPGTWELDPATLQWELRTPGFGPGGPAAFDLSRGRAVVLGWRSATWEYDGLGTAISPYLTQQPIGGVYVEGDRIELTAEAAGTAPLSYQWLRDDVPLSDGGNISGALTPTLVIDPATLSDTGYYEIAVSNSCATTRSFPEAHIQVEYYCYANCDGSTTPPILNVADFACFMQKFAFGCPTPSPCYPNCYHSPTLIPFLNVADFNCFLAKFAAGCP